MSTDPRAAGSREPASQAVSGYMAALAMFAAVVSIVYYPGRIGPGAILIALVACGMAGPAQRRLTAAALALAAVCWFAGMVVSIALKRPLF